MENEIILNNKNEGSFLGALAAPYAYKRELRLRLDELFQAAKRSDNRYFVLEGTICRAAGATRAHALHYMSNGDVLVHVDIPARLGQSDKPAHQATVLP